MGDQVTMSEPAASCQPVAVCPPNSGLRIVTAEEFLINDVPERREFAAVIWRSAIRSDVAFGLLAGLSSFIALIIWVIPVGAAITGAAAIILAGFGGAIKVTSGRQSLIKLFTSEIRAIQYGLSEMNMLDFWCRAHADPDGVAGFADTPRAEIYFAIFHAASTTIVNQHPLVVESVVRFYTYFKMSRDAAGSLARWNKKTIDEKRLDVQYVVRLLSLAMFWGYVARFDMGDPLDPADALQLLEIERVMKSVLGKDGFSDLYREHPRYDALRIFFPAALSF